ncbi:peptidoglycan/LPS O-acetylase OafA/YrhL [Azospirillum agricola]|uniref:hypothetical protein n=1 Tax=Azospirillum agricola TaxID=1720247 RepID=UPI001AE3FE3A|nr:hypothetical protein [Azospirillum agricola]MBP2231396.1 peptidoglycan/LPS O-acetylase OafA/YrhL [Azospirillum agricola]
MTAPSITASSITASSASFRTACLFAIAGLGMGIGMAASHDHTLMPVHAHINLMGWVSLFLFGIYYRLHPALETKRLALAQVGLWSLGTVALVVAVAGLHLGYPAFEPVAALASLVVLAAFGLFAVLVFRSGGPARAPSPLMTPAE